MEIIIVDNYEEMSKKAFEIISNQIKNKPNSILGLATGSTPIKLYKLLSNAKLDWSRIITFNLDEYIGLSDNHIQSYKYFMNENLFKNINIKIENTNIPNSFGDLKENCRNYDDKIDSFGGIDLQLLGIGKNGHIGFNEPPVDFDIETNVVNLTKETIEDNSRFFSNINDVPKKAISMGIKSIMKSKKILLLASGKNKSQAIYDTVKGKINKNVPASILQEHSNVILILDKEANSLLK